MNGNKTINIQLKVQFNAVVYSSLQVRAEEGRLRSSDYTVRPGLRPADRRLEVEVSHTCRPGEGVFGPVLLTSIALFVTFHQLEATNHSFLGVNW